MKFEFKNRVIKYPHIKRIIPVPGETDIYEISEISGNQVRAGTPLNAENLNKLIKSGNETSPEFVDIELQYPNRKRLKPEDVDGEENIYSVEDVLDNIINAGTSLNAEVLNALIEANFADGSDDISEIEYVCNGVNDNELLSEISRQFFNRQGDFANYDVNASLQINVTGSVGITSPMNTPFFTFGVWNYQGKQKLYFNWENADFGTITKDLTTEYYGGSTHIDSAIFSNIGKGYIEHDGAKIRLNFLVQNSSPWNMDEYRYLRYSIFSGSHAKYLSCDGKFYGNFVHYVNRVIDSNQNNDYYEILRVFAGSNNTYENCTGLVYMDAHSDAVVYSSYSGTSHQFRQYTDCYAFDGLNNTYRDCKGFAYADVFASGTASICSASVGVWVFAAAAHQADNSKLYNCTFGGMYSGYALSTGRNEGGIGAYGDNITIDSCKFPFTTFCDPNNNCSVTNSCAQPIVAGGTVIITNNIFSNQLQSSYWPSNAAVSGNSSATLTESAGW